MKTELSDIAGSFRKAIVLVALIWLVYFIQIIWGFDPGLWGIVPRTAHGLIGIFTGPFMHGDVMHIFSNTLPMVVLLTFSWIFYPSVTGKMLIWVTLMTGVWVWVAARPSSHIGASGILYGIASFLFFSGLIRKDIRSLLVSLAVAILYGGMAYGIFPNEPGISFESHIFGAVAGLVLAWWFRKLDRVPKRKYFWEDEPDGYLDDPFAEWNFRQQIMPPRDFDEEWKSNKELDSP